jgi:hypothetical protein
MRYSEDPEYGGERLIRNVSSLSKDYAALQQSRYDNSIWSPIWEPETFGCTVCGKKSWSCASITMSIMQFHRYCRSVPHSYCRRANDEEYQDWHVFIALVLVQSCINFHHDDLSEKVPSEKVPRKHTIIIIIIIIINIIRLFNLLNPYSRTMPWGYSASNRN